MQNSTSIRVLDERTIKKIKAGEVIENPASVVKELVENSLDAGATEICVEIKSGGRELIRVTDNGCGMSREDALLCFEMHATSKIREVEDIQDISTMGFRGEAIPSIASISKFTLITCPQGEKPEMATLIRVAGNEKLSCSQAARSPGTTIEVKSLFFNVPVRRNFQRSPAYDTQEIYKRMVLFILGYPNIQFSLISDQKNLISTALSYSPEPLSERIEMLLGREFLSSSRPVKFHREPYSVEGFIGEPSFTKPQKTGQYLFINRRAVVSSFISSTVREAYGTLLAPQRYPVFVLNVSMPGSLYDVNVHPQKREIRLRDESNLEKILIDAVQSSIRKQSFGPIEFHESAPVYPTYNQLSDLDRSCEIHENGKPFKWQFKDNAEKNTADFEDQSKLIRSFTVVANVENRHVEDLIPLAPPKKISPKILKTFPGYILVEPDMFGYQGGFGLIDQHAASIRLHYDRLSKQINDPVAIQTLLMPLTIDLSGLESELLRQNIDLLQQLGVQIRDFGPYSFAIDAYPTLFSSAEQLINSISNLLADFREGNISKLTEEMDDKRKILTAQRLAIPSSRELMVDEAHRLLIELLSCENWHYSPKGKKIFVHLPLDKIQVLFH